MQIQSWASIQHSWQQTLTLTCVITFSNLIWPRIVRLCVHEPACVCSLKVIKAHFSCTYHNISNCLLACIPYLQQELQLRFQHPQAHIRHPQAHILHRQAHIQHPQAHILCEPVYNWVWGKGKGVIQILCIKCRKTIYGTMVQKDHRSGTAVRTCDPSVKTATMADCGASRGSQHGVRHQPHIHH